ncbi:MAG: DUF4870 domain-containing protein [Gemmatimonadota bacterium]|nr:DUF4870 domain-containing protein [Gemmatimonadota bacterium]
MTDPTERPVQPTPEPGPAVPAGSGIAPNMAGALAYFLGALSGVLFLVIDKDRSFVRFHAMQSIVLTVAWIAVWVVLSVLSAVPFVGWLVGLLLSIAIGIGGFVLWIYLMYRAYSGDEWEVPVVGPYARRFASEV